MKALTLTQPYATLVMIGAKRMETRGWCWPDYLGLTAIHSSKNFPPWARDLCFTPVFHDALSAAGINDLAALPLGSVLGVVDVLGWHRTDDEGAMTKVVNRLSSRELAFGNFAPRRFAIPLDVVLRLESPIALRGSLGLWDLPKEVSTYLLACATQVERERERGVAASLRGEG
jgi:hypothetical protein